MSYLNESEEVTRLRNSFCEMIRHGGCPSMCKMKMWAQLKNAIINEAYAKAGHPTPATALESFGLKTARELIGDLKLIYKRWDFGELTDAAFLSKAHEIERQFEVLTLHGRVSESEEDRFHDEYASSIMAATDVPDLSVKDPTPLTDL